MGRIYIYSDAGEYGERERVGYFDQDRAESWDGATEWDGNNNADINAGANRSQTLYRTAGGRWAIRHDSAWVNERTWYEHVEPKAAHDWLLFNGHDAAAEKYFGEAADEIGPGRPEIGGAVHVRLGELVTQLDEWAAANDMTRAEAAREAVRRLVTA